MFSTRNESHPLRELDALFVNIYYFKSKYTLSSGEKLLKAVVMSRGSYKKGLAGQKPSSIFKDKDQEKGYRDHLRNVDLAERLRGGPENENPSDQSYGEHIPLKIRERVLFFILAGIWLLAVWHHYLPQLLSEWEKNNPATTFGVFIAGGIWSIPAVACIIGVFLKKS